MSRIPTTTAAPGEARDPLGTGRRPWWIARASFRAGRQDAAVAVQHAGDRLLAKVPAELEAPVGEDGRVDDREARAVGGGARGGRDGAHTRTRSASAGCARRSTKPASVSTTTATPPHSASHGQRAIRRQAHGERRADDAAARATWASAGGSRRPARSNAAAGPVAERVPLAEDRARIVLAAEVLAPRPRVARRARPGRGARASASRRRPEAALEERGHRLGQRLIVAGRAR